MLPSSTKSFSCSCKLSDEFLRTLVDDALDETLPNLLSSILVASNGEGSSFVSDLS